MMASQMCTEQQENSNSASAAELTATESEPKVTKETPRHDKTQPIVTPTPRSSSKGRKFCFTDCCMALYKEFKHLHKDYGELIIPTDLWKDVKQIKEKLLQERKNITISVFGPHNCGKSTFINALIGTKLLPIWAMNCTAMRVKIQNEDSIHPGSCSDACQYQLMESCPRLLQHGRTVVLQCSPIYDYLKRKNKEARDRQTPYTEVVLEVNIPMLDERVPMDWKVSLMDNPGFGETMECITHLADAAMVFSSAYIYLMQPGNVEGTEAAKFFTELDKIDRAALGDGRLIIGVTKFDHVYEDDDPASIETVKQNIIQSVATATGVSLSEDVIIPLCGKWALSDSEFIHQLNAVEDGRVPPQCIQSIIAAFKRSHILDPLPAGQGQTQEEAIAQLGPKEIVKKLEIVTGISSMRARIQDVVGKACIITWSKKIYTQLINYVQDTARRIDSVSSNETEKRDEKDRTHKDLTGLYKEIQSTRRGMEASRSVATGRTIKSPTAWEKLKESYRLDVKDSDCSVLGKETSKFLIEGIRKRCKDKLEADELSSTDLEIDIQDFLIECQPKLQKVFNNCSFHNMEASLAHLNEEAVKQFASLKYKSKKLIGKEYSDSLISSEAVGHQESKKFSRSNELLTCDKFVSTLRNQLRNALTADLEEASGGVNEHKSVCAQPSKEDHCPSAEVTNLGHLRSSGSVPCVSLPWWKRIAAFIRKWIVGSPSDSYISSSESTLSNTTKALDVVLDPAVLKSYYVIDSQLSIREITLPCAEQDSIFNHRHIDQPPLKEENDPNDSTGECSDSSASPNTRGRKQIDERLLDETIDFVQKLMEEECDQYFERIEPEAIKHFYDKHSSKITAYLRKFDEEFNDQLQNKTHQMQQLKKEIDSLKTKIADLNKKKEDLLKRQTELNVLWDNMGLVVDEAARERTQERKRQRVVINELQSIF